MRFHLTAVVPWISAAVAWGQTAAPAQLPPRPDTVQAYYERAEAAEAVGNYGAAIRDLRGAIRVEPGDERLHLALGVAFFHEGQVADALGEFRAAIELQPGDMDARRNLADVWMSLGEAESALPELTRVVAAAPEDSASRSQLGLCYLQLGRWRDAAREYTALVAADPASPELLYNLAVARKHLEDDEGAQRLLRKSLELRPEFVAARFELGEIYWQSGMLDDAIRELQSVCKTRPDFALAYFPLAEAQRQKGDRESAMMTIQAALRLGPSPSAYQQLAILKKQQGDVDGAAAAFHQAELLRNQAKLRQAAQLATAAAKRFIETHDTAAAIRKLEFALRVDPDLADAHFQLALALRQQDPARARREFQKTFQLDPRLKPPHEP